MKDTHAKLNQCYSQYFWLQQAQSPEGKISLRKRTCGPGKKYVLSSITLLSDNMSHDP